MRLLLLVVVASCASGATPAPPHNEPPPSDQQRHYTIWLGGARVGTAVETESWTASGVVLQRLETMRFLRGQAPIALSTTIEIAADRQLRPLRVDWTESAALTRHAEAVHDASGWNVTVDGGHVQLPANAIPGELVPLLVRRDGRFEGMIFLPARGFVVGEGRIDPVAPSRLVARLALDAGPIAEATIDLDRDGMPTRVVDGEGVIAMRSSAAEAQAGYVPVDVIAATSVPVTGKRSGRIALQGDVTPPPVPGQAARMSRGALELELSARLPGELPPGPPGADRTSEIANLVLAVRARIEPDLRAGPGSRRDAEAATAGDCTTYALAYAALAESRSIPTRVITGLRVDGDRLIRHRWAASWTGRAWIAVDAAFGAAPAGGNLIGLAIHGADDAGLVAGEAALTSVRAATWLR